MGAWLVRLAPNFETWLRHLDAYAQDAVVAGIELLEESGPWIDLPSMVLTRGAPGFWTLLLVEGRLQVGYRWDPMTDEILLTHGHNADDAAGSQLQATDAFGAAVGQLAWEVSDDSRLQ